MNTAAIPAGQRFQHVTDSPCMLPDLLAQVILAFAFAFTYRLPVKLQSTEPPNQGRSQAERNSASHTTITGIMDASPLAILPAELRNEVWQRVLTCATPLNLIGIPPPLTRAWPQIRAETEQLYYVVNDFVLHADFSKPSALPANQIFIFDATKPRLVHSIIIEYHAGCDKHPETGVSYLLVNDAALQMLASALAGKGLRRDQVEWAVVPDPETPAVVNGHMGRFFSLPGRRTVDVVREQEGKVRRVWVEACGEAGEGSWGEA